MSALQRLFTAVALLCFVAFSMACASSDAPACSTNSDCADGEVCETGEGVCMEVSVDPCEDDDECPSGRICDNGLCVEPDPDHECTSDGDCGDFQICDGGECIDDPSLSCTFNDDCDGNEICLHGFCTVEPDDFCVVDGDCGSGTICLDNACVDDESNTNQPNLDNPSVVSVTPDDEEVGVSVDTEIRISFDMDMNPTQSTHPSNLRVMEQSTDTVVEGNYEYLSDEREVIITPDQPLLPGTEYMIDVRGPTSMEGRPVEPSVRTSFITDWEIDADVEELVHRYAPVIYQAVDDVESPDTEGNIPTTVDFDGNLDASDNLQRAQSGNFDQSATVYYSYTYTDSHHFLHYILYYPYRTDSVGIHDHDFVGLVVVVDRETEEVLLVDTANSTGKRHAYRPDRDGQPSTIPADEEPTDFDPDTLEDDGDRFPLYVPDGEHTACHWHERDTGGIIFGPCTGDPETFRTGEGFVLTPGSAQTFDEATENGDGLLELEYGLVPFIDPFWTRLGDLSSDLFTGTTSTYTMNNDRPVGPRGETLRLRSRLAAGSQGDENFGLLPYVWVDIGQNSSGGAWFLDPAWRLASFYDFGDDFSSEYCYNFYFQIDRTGDAECQD